MLAIACLVWSLTNVFSGEVDSLGLFAVNRFIFGAASSICEPAAFSLIGSLFPGNNIATANSIFATA
jgi:MFS family permease